MQEHIDSPWFNRFIEDLINDEWEGVGGSLFQFFLDDKGWIDYNLIPRKHVDAINRTILCNQTDLTGESWDDFSDLLYVGNPRQIGHLAVAAFWVYSSATTSRTGPSWARYSAGRSAKEPTTHGTTRPARNS